MQQDPRQPRRRHGGGQGEGGGVGVHQQGTAASFRQAQQLAWAHLSAAEKLMYSEKTNYYLWLEIYAGLYILMLAVLWGLSSITYLTHLRIGAWFAPQLPFPASFISNVFFVGPPPQTLYHLQKKRFWVHLVFASVWGGLCICANIAFIVVQIVYATSASCQADPSSVCQHISTLVVVLCLSGLLILCAGFAIFTIVASLNSAHHKTAPGSSLAPDQGDEELQQQQQQQAPLVSGKAPSPPPRAGSTVIRVSTPP
jgi:hypothetical protein